jgi:hypothetical protein
MRATALAVPVLSQCGHADIVQEGSVFNEVYKGPSLPYLSRHSWLLLLLYQRVRGL